jgi:hypothetical protein
MSRHKLEIGVYDNESANAGNRPECTQLYETRSTDSKRTNTEQDKTQLLKRKKVRKRQSFSASSDTKKLEKDSGSVFENK